MGGPRGVALMAPPPWWPRLSAREWAAAGLALLIVLAVAAGRLATLALGALPAW